VHFVFYLSLTQSFLKMQEYVPRENSILLFVQTLFFCLKLKD
jgi:hypothetical protein